MWLSTPGYSRPDLDVALHDPPALIGGQRVPLAATSRTGRRTRTCRGSRGASCARLLSIRSSCASPGTSGGCAPTSSGRSGRARRGTRGCARGSPPRRPAAARRRRACPTSEKRLQQVPVGEVLAGGQELALVLLARSAVQAPPGRVDLQERVLDEVAAAHALRLSHRRGARGLWKVRTRRSLPMPPTRGRVECVAVRIALLSPYSWTYPGGVTRHIEALAAELAADGHEPRILAPFDPDDALSARLHRGARPQRRPLPESFVSLGRTVGLPANGAVSNMAAHARTRCSALRRELRSGGYDVAAHPRAGRADRRLGRAAAPRASCRSWAPSTPTRRTP